MAFYTRTNFNYGAIHLIIDFVMHWEFYSILLETDTVLVYCI